MDKDQLINDFFRSFRAALTNSFAYPKDHPYFLKSAENFKLKLEEVLAFLVEFKIGVTDLSLVVNGEVLTGVDFYGELARLLHQRKIKNIEIKSNVTLGQIVGFFSIISLSPKDIFKNGGINALIEKQHLANFIIEELDYSAFLQEGDQECTDVWGCMLKDALQSNNQAKFDNLVDNFGTLIKRTNQNDIFENQEIPANINAFLVSLREKNKEQFEKCSKDLFLWFLHNKKFLSQKSQTELKLIFDSLNQEDLGALFWAGISQEENFDALSLELFSKISEQKNPSKIAGSFLNNINAAGNLNNNPKVVKRIKDLLTQTQGDQLSAVYRNTLEVLIKDVSLTGVLLFDQKALKENYRYIVLNIFSTDKDLDNLLLAAEVLEKELAEIFQDNNLGFLKDFWSQLVKRRKEGISVCMDLEKKFCLFIENIILTQVLSPEQECLLEMVSSPSQEPSFYLDKIFAEGKVNKQVLSLFFKFFPGNLDIFYQKVEQRLQDIDFLFSLIQALGELALPVTLGILGYLYSSGNEIIKLEILKTMRKLKKVDPEFLLRQLSTDSPALKKKLLSVLMLDALACEGALDLLLNIPSFFGKKNQLLIENMQIVFDLGLTQALSRIQELSCKRFFWNQQLRAKANEILKEWNAH